MAPLKRMAPDPGALLATHVAFQLMHRRRLRFANDGQVDGLMGVAAEAAKLKESKPAVSYRDRLCFSQGKQRPRFYRQRTWKQPV